jgi:hypothetical protein
MAGQVLSLGEPGRGGTRSEEVMQEEGNEDRQVHGGPLGPGGGFL